MTYSEIILSINSLMTANDPRGIVGLITFENVGTVRNYIGDAFVSPASRIINDMEIILDDYDQLVSRIVPLVSSSDVDAILTKFIIDNAILSSFGREYETIVDTVVEGQTEEGFTYASIEAGRAAASTVVTTYVDDTQAAISTPQQTS